MKLAKSPIPYPHGVRWGAKQRLRSVLPSSRFYKSRISRSASSYRPPSFTAFPTHRNSKFTTYHNTHGIYGMSKIPSRTATVSLDPTLVDHSARQDDGKVVVAADRAPTPPYQLSIEQVASQYEADTEGGLTDSQATERLQRYGLNELQGGEGVSWVRVLVSQIGLLLRRVLVAAH